MPRRSRLHGRTRCRFVPLARLADGTAGFGGRPEAEERVGAIAPRLERPPVLANRLLRPDHRTSHIAQSRVHERALGVTESRRFDAFERPLGVALSEQHPPGQHQHRRLARRVQQRLRPRRPRQARHALEHVGQRAETVRFDRVAETPQHLERLRSAGGRGPRMCRDPPAHFALPRDQRVREGPGELAHPHIRVLPERRLDLPAADSPPDLAVLSFGGDFRLERARLRERLTQLRLPSFDGPQRLPDQLVDRVEVLCLRGRFEQPRDLLEVRRPARDHAPGQSEETLTGLHRAPPAGSSATSTIAPSTSCQTASCPSSSPAR